MDYSALVAIFLISVSALAVRRNKKKIGKNKNS